MATSTFTPTRLPLSTPPHRAPHALRRLVRSLRCAAAPPDGGQPSLSSPGELSADLAAFPGTARSGTQPSTRLDQPPKVDAAPGQSEYDWDGWSAFFDELDEAATRLEELDAMLQNAVSDEDYAAAAELKQEMQAVMAKDSVATVLKALDDALVSENYSEAARLRDEGGAGLLGWWQGRAGPDDAQGHLLRIEAEFGRYVGTMYKAADLADVKGLSEDSFFSGSTTPRSLRDVGVPMMEIFVRARPDGTLAQQVCALVPAQSDAESTIQVEASLLPSADGSTEMDPEASAALIGKTVGELFGLSVDDERGSIVAEIVDEDDDDDEEEDEEESSDEDEGVTISGRVLRTINRDDENKHDDEEDDEDDEDHDDDEVSALPQQGMSLKDAGIVSLEDNIVSSAALFPFSHGLEDDMDGEEMLLESGDVVMHRAAAVITKTGRDSFEYEVLRVPEEEVGEGHHGQEEEEEASTSSSSGDAAKEKEMLPESLRGSSTTPSTSTSQQTLHTKVLQAARNLAGRQRDAGDITSSRADMEQELRRMTRDLLRQSYGVSEDAGGLRIERVAIQSSFCDQASYSRLVSSGVRTDPLSGLFIGAFGMHGPELLQLTRGVDEEGEEMVFATKVTGDENVPAGSVSFKARIGRRHRLDPNEYPPELGVVSRYKGEGRIALQNFSNPRWVDGELLQFSRNNSPATRHADLGFVWSMPQGSKYLILLNRVSLEELV